MRTIPGSSGARRAGGPMSVDDVAAPPGEGTARPWHVPLEGCVNFREVSGYPLTSGGRIRPGRLFRSDGLGRLTAADVGVVRGLGVRTVIDLRTAGEVAERGRIPVDDLPVSYHSLPLMDVLPAPEELPSWRDPAFVAGQYLAMVETGGEALAAAVRILAGDGATPAVVHCSAGKDRTGVTVALVLGMVGVGDDDIVADYARSAAAMPALLARLKEDHPDASAAVDEYAPAILHAEPATMRSFIGSVGRRFGGWPGLVDRLGVAGEVTALRDALVDPG